MSLALFRTFSILCVFAGLLSAAPKLRLSTTTVGPLSIAQGQNGAIQTVEAGNFGDGSFGLAASSNVTWISATIGQQHSCTLNGTCTPVNLRLDTAALAKGIYTGIVTVSDPNAIDAPQTIVVTVQIGGGVPDKVELFVPPNGSPIKQNFTANARLGTVITPPLGGVNLSVAMAAAGSYDFSFSYTIQVTAPSGTAEHDYTAAINVTESTFQPDRKTIPVTLHVTSQPIASLTPGSLSFRAAQGTAKVDKWLIISNAGLGNLSMTAVTPATNGGGPWLTAQITNGIVIATADPGTLAPGVYAGKLAVATNAVNPVNVDVQFEVLATKGPTVQPGRVVDNAANETDLALGGIVQIFGEQFTTKAAAQAAKLPLETSLGGATVFLNDQPIPIYYTAASHVVNPTGQINAVIPYEARLGAGVLRVDRDGQRGNSVSVNIVRSAPRILKLGIGNYGIVVNLDSSFPIPPTAGINSHPAKAGDTLVIYALGLGPTDPLVQSGVGAPVDPLARVTAGFRVYFGGSGPIGSPANVFPDFIGLTPGLVGLYQINVVVPANAPVGAEVPIYFTNDLITSNRVNIAIQ